MGVNNIDAVLGAIRDTRLLRKRDHEVRKDIADGHYVFLAPTQVLKADQFAALSSWQVFLARAVATGRSMRKGILVSKAAGAVRGLWVLTRAHTSVEVALPSGGTPSKQARMPQVRYRQAAFRDEELALVRGVRITSDIRTFIDIARYHGFREGLLAADWLCSLAGYDRAQLLAEIHRMGRFVGKKEVLGCARVASSVSESPYESLFRAELILRHIRGWEFQKSIGSYRPDFLFDGFLIVEIDGRSKYTDQPREVLLRERERERALMNRGYVFIRVHPEDLLQRMSEVLDAIERAREGRRMRPEVGGAGSA